MRRLHIFLIILTAAAGLLLILVAVNLFLSAASPSYYQSSWMNQMWRSEGFGGSTGRGNNGGMGGMMGGDGAGTSNSNLWIIPIALVAAVAVGVIGFGFYLAYPEIRNIRWTCEPTKNEPAAAGPTKSSGIDASTKAASNSCEVLLKTMTP